MRKEPVWLDFAKKIQAIGQAGLAFTNDEYDKERYHELMDISFQMMNLYGETDIKIIQGLFKNEKGYPTPKVDVRAAVFHKKRLLFVKEKADGLWALPGGWAESYLSVRENIIKETKEEAGMDVEPIRLIAVYNRKKHNKPPRALGIYKIFVLCRFLGGSFTKNLETSEADFFSKNQLPVLASAKNNQEQIDMCFHAYENPDFIPYFD